MPVAIKGSGGGSVTLDAGAAAADTTLTLPNTTGTVALTGSPTFSGTVTATTITSPASTALTIQSAGTTAMTVSTSQNIGIGTTSPGQRLDIQQASTDYQMRIGDAGGNYYDIGRNTGNGLLTFYGNQAAASGYVFSTVNGERMRIDTSGNLLVGRTSLATFSGLSGANVQSSNGFSVTNGTVASQYTVDRISFNVSNFYVLNASSTGVVLVNGNTSWAAQSDERLKDIIEPIADAVDKVSTLRSVIGRYKTDDDSKRRAFLIAQDVQSVLPEAVFEDADGHLLLGYSETIPLLVAAIQELSAHNDALEARLAALEAK